MMRPVFQSLMSLFPAPAYAFAGAATSLRSPSQGFRNPLDAFSMAGRNTIFDTRAHDRISTTLFAIATDDTVLITPRFDEPAGPDPVGPSSPPTDTVTAYVAYTALISIPIRHNVILNDQALVNLLFGPRGWMKEVPDGQREAMKTLSARLESLEAELGELEQTLKQNRPTLRKFLNAAKGLFDRKRSAQREGGSESDDGRKGSILNLTGMFRNLKAKKRELKKEIEHATLAREWLDYTAWSNCGYVLLTDAGRRIMAALDKAKGDPRMEKMSVDDFLKLINAKIL